MRFLAASMAVALLVTTGAFAQDASVEGNWKDRWGTSFKMNMCGDGTQLCAVLTDVQGESRTKENLAYVGRQVIKANMTAPNEWEGTLTFNGDKAKGKVTQVDPDTIKIQGCRGLFCSTLVFNRV